MQRFRIERCTDRTLIRSVITDPRIWRHLSDDGSPPRAFWEPVIGPGSYWIAISPPATQAVAGFFWGHRVRHRVYEVHTAFLPPLRGALAVEAGIACQIWTRRNMDALTLQTWVPAYNRAARAFAEACGMAEMGCLPGGWVRRGRAETVWLYGMSLGDEVNR